MKLETRFSMINVNSLIFVHYSIMWDVNVTKRWRIRRRLGSSARSVRRRSANTSENHHHNEHEVVAQEPVCVWLYDWRSESAAREEKKIVRSGGFADVAKRRRSQVACGCARGQVPLWGGNHPLLCHTQTMHAVDQIANQSRNRCAAVFPLLNFNCQRG